MKRTSGSRVTKIVCNSVMDGRIDRGKPSMRWLDGVKKTYNAKSLRLRDAWVNCKD